MKAVKGKCIVIGAGDLSPVRVRAEEKDCVIAVDGGLGYARLLGLEPDLLIGDFDSVSEEEAAEVEALEQLPGRVIRLPEEKDDTDMLAALKEGLARGYREFRIYAGMGGRFDHTFANIQCLLFLKNQGATGYLVDGMGMMLVIRNEAVHFQKNVEGILSLFSLVEETRGVTIEGMKYSLKDAVIRNDFPIGVSNLFIGEEAMVSVEDGSLICMISYANQV